ncbi:MAG: hypothetical protein ACRDRN_07235 [Sciscionella sp.]
MSVFAIRDEPRRLRMQRGYEAVGISIINPTDDAAHDVVTWLDPTHAAWLGRVLKIELLGNVSEAGVNRVIVRAGTPTDAITKRSAYGHRLLLIGRPKQDAVRRHSIEPR